MPRLQQLVLRAAPTVEELHILRGIARAVLRAASGGSSRHAAGDAPPGPLD
jgi:tRNA/rRNA methyltransferase